MNDAKHREFLGSVTVGSLLKDNRDLFFITPSTTIGETTRIMTEKNILALPIWDERNQAWVGSIDMFSLMTYIAFGRCTQDSKSDDTLFSKFHYTDQEVGPLRLVSRATQKMMIYPDSHNMLTILEILTYTAHRIFIQSSTPAENIHKSLHLFSQTDAVTFLWQNINNLGNIVDKFVNELGLVDELPILMSSHETALQGFRTIRLMCVNALGIIDDSGALVANLSASDVRGLTSDQLKLVKSPVLEYLRSRHPEGKLVHVVTCNPKSTLREVILQLFTAKIHRVWVIDSATKPVGVITLSDICRTFAFN